MFGGRQMRHVNVCDRNSVEIVREIWWMWSANFWKAGYSCQEPLRACWGGGFGLVFTCLCDRHVSWVVSFGDFWRLRVCSLVVR